MTVFVDTSAILAALVACDPRHPEAAAAWHKLNAEGHDLVATNYVVLEFLTLLQHRHGMSLVRAAYESVLPVVAIHWVTPEEHGNGLADLLAANRRGLSLVDCISFAAMRHLGVTTVFTLDAHFAEQGFTAMPV